MNIPSRLWKELQLLGWLLFLGYMILTGKDQSYLASLQHQILLVGGGLLFLAFLIGLFGSVTPTETFHHRGAVLALACESLGHWVPLLIVGLMGVTTLNMDLASLRDRIQMRVLDPNQTVEDLGAKLRYLKPGEYLEVTHIQLYNDSRLESNARISLIGRVARLNAEQHRKAFPHDSTKENSLLLYRFAIACCAADASPLTVILEGIPPEATLSEEEWYRVSGVTQTPQESGPIFLQVERLETMSAPEKPFLSWLDAL
ncbi:MAG: hypothetical protein HQL98_07760 [Magnetococcales bacterium]|nr:hypothetical protein [Magnetococcales bacterium]